ADDPAALARCEQRQRHERVGGPREDDEADEERGQRVEPRAVAGGADQPPDDERRCEKRPLRLSRQTALPQEEPEEPRVNGWARLQGKNHALASVLVRRVEPQCLPEPDERLVGVAALEADDSEQVMSGVEARVESKGVARRAIGLLGATDCYEGSGVRRCGGAVTGIECARLLCRDERFVSPVELQQDRGETLL